MASDKHMIDTLSDMLQEGENLMYPLFGTVNQLFAYFAFTETHFLIAYLSGEQIIDTARVPLNVKSVQIRKSKILKEYIIDILFDSNLSLKISAFPKVLKIKSQESNFPLFLEYLRSKSKKQAPNLEETDGEKIRWQYFNTYIYMILCCVPTAPMMIIMTQLRKGNFDVWNIIVEMSGAFPVLAVMYGIFIGPFVILSIFNRFSFGKVLGVVSDDTLIVENREIPLSDIEEIVYHPRIVSKRQISYSYATFVVRSKADNTESFDIVHFPLYGLRKIKKHNKNIKLSCDKYIWFLILCPTVVCAVLGFILG